MNSTLYTQGGTENDIVKYLDIQSGGKNVIGLYQQEVNILSQRGFAVAKQQEYRDQSHFCFLKGVVFSVSSFCAIPYDLQHPYSQDLKAEKTKGYYNTCPHQIFQNIRISIYITNVIVSTKRQDNALTHNPKQTGVVFLYKEGLIENISSQKLR